MAAARAFISARGGSSGMLVSATSRSTIKPCIVRWRSSATPLVRPTATVKSELFLGVVDLEAIVDGEPESPVHAPEAGARAAVAAQAGLQRATRDERTRGYSHPPRPAA